MPPAQAIRSGLGLVCTVGIAASTAPASAGQFDGVTVRIGTFGGKWRDIVDSYVAKAFEQEGGKIEYVLGQPANNMAKLIAARGHEPPFDLFETMDNFLPQLAAGNFTEPLDPTQVPNLRELDKSMYDSGKVMIWITQSASSTIRRSSPRLAYRAATSTCGSPRARVAPRHQRRWRHPAIVGMSYEGAAAGRHRAADLVKKIAPANFWSSSNLRRCSSTRLAAAAQAGTSSGGARSISQSCFQIRGPGQGRRTQAGLSGEDRAPRTPGAGVDHQPVLSQPTQVAVLTEGGRYRCTARARRADQSQYSPLRLSAEDCQDV